MNEELNAIMEQLLSSNKDTAVDTTEVQELAKEVLIKYLNAAKTNKNFISDDEAHVLVMLFSIVKGK